MGKKAVKTDGTAQSPPPNTDTYTQTQNWKVASSGINKQTARSDYEHQKHFNLLAAYPMC